MHVFKLMASTRKKRMAQAAKKRESRGRIYIIAILAIIVIAIGVGWYVYSSSQSANLPSFTIAAPTGVTIHAGQQTTSTINVTSTNGFQGTVTLSVSASTGLTATIKPQNITGSGTATLTMSAAQNGTYTATVTGTSGGVIHSVTPAVDTPVYATLQTTNGTIVVELFRAQTPQTVANFVSLANRHFYNGLVWHRIIPGFVIQTGDPKTVNGTGDRSTWGQGTSGQNVPFEYDNSLNNTSGYLGMASTGAGTGGSSQFYINLSDNSASLDGKYAVFGRVVTDPKGAVNALAGSQTTNQYPNAQNQPVNPLSALLLSVTIS